MEKKAEEKRETLQSLLRRLFGKNVTTRNVGYVILYSVTNNRERNPELYRSTTSVKPYQQAEMEEMLSGLENMVRKNKVPSITVEQRKLIEQPGEIYQLFFVYDAVRFLRQRSSSLDSIASSLGDRAYNLHTQPQRPLDTWQDYSHYLANLGEAIKRKYHIQLPVHKL